MKSEMLAAGEEGWWALPAIHVVYGRARSGSGEKS